MLTVADSGPGIPPELQQKIFDFDFSGSNVDNPGNLGFGLWWVKTMMTRFGGTVTVASDGEHGTAFSLRLPVSREEPDG